MPGTGTKPEVRPATDDQISCCKCDCGCSSYSTSSGPVRYFNGELEFAAQDLTSAGFGHRWGHTRYYLNRIVIDGAPTTYDFGQGYNWLVAQWPYITIKSAGVLEVVRGMNEYFFFEEVGDGSYAPLFGVMQSLEHDEGAGLFRMTDPDGTVWEFQDFDQGDQAGTFSRVVTPGDQAIGVQAYVGAHVGVVERTFGSGATQELEQYVYTYVATGPNANRLESVTLRRQIAGTSLFANIRRTRYEYYGASDASGSVGDLKLAIHQLPQGTAWVDQDTHYYRYWKNSAGGKGFQHGLKFVLQARAFQRLATAADPLTAPDSLVAEYADFYFEYDEDHRVSSEKTAAGTQPAAFVVEPRTGEFTLGYNVWSQKTTETLADGSQNIVFTNHVGQVILHDKTDGTKHWLNYFEYDELEAHTLLHAHPSAVSGYSVDPDTGDLTVDLHAGEGLIEITDYYAATNLPAGAVKDYKSYDKIKQGSAGTEIILRKTEYTSATAGGITIYPVSKTIVYRNENGTGAIATSFSYTYHSGTLQVEQQTTTLPVVSVGQNGDGATYTQEMVFDALGFPNWSQDARGYITYRAFNLATGALVQEIQDVDMTRMSGVPGNPGWTTPAGGGLHLVSDYESDAVGRVTQSLGPWHDVNGQAVRTAGWTVFKDLDHEVWSAQGYVTDSGGGSADASLANPVSLTRMDAGGMTTDQIQVLRRAPSVSNGSCSGTPVEVPGRLSAAECFPQSSWCRWSHLTADNAGRTTATRTYHAIHASGEGSPGDNYNETTYAYDLLNRQNRTQTPGHTITRVVYDVRGLAVSTWVGTDDTGATDADPTGGGAAGNNLVQLAENQYDDGADGGDGNLTQVIQFVDSETDRTTSFEYDFRNRKTSEQRPEGIFFELLYNNLDQLIRRDQRDTDLDIVIARTETNFDDRGRVYQSIRYDVNQATGAMGDKLVDNTWYDPSGNVIQSQSAASEAWTKTTSDGLGRATRTMVGYSDGEDDLVFEQTDATYDEAGSVISTSLFQRYHDDTTSTGPLVAGTSARPQYAAAWFDGVGRSIASANYGTNGGAEFVRPAEAPATSETVLVSAVRYSACGEAFESVDPLGIVNHTEFDDAGRTVRTIQNYLPGSTDADANLTAEMTYNADGRQATLTAVNAATGDQTTRYEYGVSAASGSKLASNDLLRETVYPDGGLSTVRYRYNRQGERIGMTDQNGTVHAYALDHLGRMIADEVTALGTGIDGAVRKLRIAYALRGMAEKLTSYNAAGSVVNEVQNQYNGLGQLTKQFQSHAGAVTGGTPFVEYTYDLTANGGVFTKGARPDTVVYPSGRVVEYAYAAADDSLGRVTSVGTDDDLTRYAYLGLGTFVETLYNSEGDTVAKLIYTGGGSGDAKYPGLDRFNRVADHRWIDGDAEDLDRFQYGYDANSNRLWRRNATAAALDKPFDELYAYDRVNRLVDFQRGTLSAGRTSIVGTPAKQQDWTLDATGNWSHFTSADEGALETDQTRLHNGANEITELSSWYPPSYDHAGNMTRLPKPAAPAEGFAATYDAWNRLVSLSEVTCNCPGDLVAQYQYDAQTWRTLSLNYVDGELADMRHYFYSARWQILEERLNALTSPERQHVWGRRYIDDLSRRYRDTDNDGDLDEVLWATQDANWNVTSAVTTDGDLAERFLCDPYGRSAVLSAEYDPVSDVYRWNILFGSYHRDDSTGLYYVRRRWYFPSLGCFVSRDPMLYSSGDCRLYSYCRSNPVRNTDPSGLKVFNRREGLWDDDLTFDDIVLVFDWRADVECDAQCEPQPARKDGYWNRVKPVELQGMSVTRPTPTLSRPQPGVLIISYRIGVSYEDANYAAAVGEGTAGAVAGAGTGAGIGAAVGTAATAGTAGAGAPSIVPAVVTGAVIGGIAGGIGGVVHGLSQTVKYEAIIAADWRFTCCRNAQGKCELSFDQSGSEFRPAGDLYLNGTRYSWWDPVPAGWPANDTD